MSRNSYPGGGAFLTARGLTIEFAEGWKADHQILKADIGTNLHGKIGESEQYVMTKITGKPIATSANYVALVAFLHPYTPELIGELIFGATDFPAVIQTRDGKSTTYPACAITKEPDITFAPNVDIFGEMELTCLRAWGGDVTDLADVADVDTSSAYTAPLVNPLTRIRSPYAVAWGSASPFNAIETDKAGVKLTKSTKLLPVEPMLYGLVNMRIDAVEAAVKFVPLNLDMDDFFAFVQLAAATAGVGSVLGLRGQQLTVTSTKVGDPKLIVPLAVPDSGPLGFDNKSRVGEVNLTSHRKSVSGVLQPLLTHGVVA